MEKNKYGSCKFWHSLRMLEYIGKCNLTSASTRQKIASAIAEVIDGEEAFGNSKRAPFVWGIEG
jgi:hypothetical protein